MIPTSWILLLCFSALTVNAFPQISDTSSLVISSTTPSTEDAVKETKVWIDYTFHKKIHFLFSRMANIMYYQKYMRCQ